MFIRLKEANFGHLKGGLCTGQVCKTELAPILESHNSVSPRFCLKPVLSKAVSWEVRRVGQVDHF